MAETEELGLEVFVEGWRQFETVMGRLDKSIDGLETSMKGTGKASGIFSVALGNLAATVVTKLAGAFVEAGKKITDFTLDSIKQAADFQDNMVILAAAASGTGLTFEELKEAALAVGGDTRILGANASDAAGAITGLFKSGLTATEVFGDLNAFMEEGAELGGALRASFDLAAASELSTEEASNLAAIALASFGSELETEAERAEFITKAMDNFVKSADASVAEVGDLAAALVNVGPTATNLGIGLEDTNLALAILSTRGIKGAEAGTALKSMLTNLQRPTKAVQEKFDDLGISLFDSEGQFIGLRQLTIDLNKSMAGMTDEQRNLTAQVLAGTFGMNAMNTLLAEGEAGWDNMAAATEDATGIQELAAAKGQTFNAQMEALDGVIETVKIRIGDALLPVATDLVKWFSAMVEEHGPAITAIFEKIGGVVGDFVWHIGELLANRLSISDVFPEGIATFIEKLISTLASLWDWLQNQIPIAVALVSDIFTTQFGFIKGAFESVAEQWNTKLKPAFETLLAWLSENLPSGISILTAIWENVWKPALEVVWGFITDSLIPALADIVVFLVENIPLAIETAKTFWEGTLKPALEAVWKFITESLVPAFEAAVLWLATNIPVAMQAIETFWKETLLPAFEAIEKWLSENIPLAIKTAQTFWEETLKPALETVWQYIVDNIIPIFLDVVEWLQTNIPLATEALALIWENTLKPALEIVWKFINDDLLPLFDALRKFFDVVLTLALEAMAGIWENVLKPALETVWEFIKDDLLPLLDALRKFFAETLTLALEAMADIWETTLKPALETVWEFLRDSLMPMLGDLANFFKVTFILAMEKANPILEGIKLIFEAISSAVGDVIGWIDNMAEKLKGLDVTKLFKPGSPTPFEVGLRGIADAMKEVSVLSEDMFASMSGSISVGANGRGVSPTASPGTQTVNYVTSSREGDQYNLNTNTVMQPGQLALEFSTMSMRSR